MSQTPAPDELQTTTGETSPGAASLPAFLPPSQPPRSRRQRPSSPRQASPDQGVTPPPLDDDEAGDGSAWEDTETSTPASTEDEGPRAKFRPIDPSTRAMYAGVVTQGAQIASGFVNARMDPEGDAFVMRDDEAADIAAPASRLLARHVPLSAAAAGQATDLTDIIELLGSLVGYVMAAMQRRAMGIIPGSGMPTGREGDWSDLRPDPAAAAVGDDYVPPAPMPAWPMPGMPPAIASGS